MNGLKIPCEFDDRHILMKKKLGLGLHTFPREWRGWLWLQIQIIVIK
jgi:hypothetical protein